MALNTGFWLIEGLRGIFVHRFTAAVTIVGIGLSLWIFGFIYLLWGNIQRYRDDVLSNIRIEAFLDTNIPDSQHISVGEQIAALGGFTGVIYISREEAAKIFAEDFGEDLFEILDDNPLPASFKLTLAPGYRETAKSQALVDQLEKIPGIEEAVFHGSLMDAVDSRFKSFSKMLAGCGLLILCGTMLVFIQGIGLSIKGRKAFINSLLLSGVKFSAIRFPFILEGIFTGAIAGSAAYLILLSGSVIIDNYFLTFVFSKNLFWIIPAGAVLGLLGSVISANRNLRGYLH